MRRINTTTLYNLGKQIKPVEAFNNEDRPYGEVFLLLFNLRLEVEQLLKDSSLSLRMCRQTADRLIAAVDRIIPREIEGLFQRDRSENVDWWLLQQVKDAAARFETVLGEELALSDTYIVTQKGAYSTSELISQAEMMLPVDVRAKLPPKALNDLREAGRCFAYETPTAAGFHIVRAIESAIVAYYEHVLGRSSPPRMRNWAVYIKAMRDSGKANGKVLDLLTHIKDTYRNPISHPEAVLSVDEVLVLMAVAVGAMTQIAMALSINA